MARRLPSQPPVLPGFSHVRVLGSGGFADVFLYEQNMPRRQVAVKVMLSEVVNEQVRQMFQAEANLMAQLSSHPSILTVYQASVSSDGRPYLVMELCSSNLNQRYRSEPLPVSEVLRIAVKIGSAIETAHRAGVLHRDIKPSNILLTAYGNPVLSDFGIAATLGESEQTEAIGLSVPWSAPEVLLDETSGTIESEVWAFGATVYSLLAGRSPFEIPGQSNKSADLIARINRAQPQPIDRADVPASLERALRRTMQRRPEQRPASVLEVIHELQAAEAELGLAVTPVEVAMDDWALATVADLEDRTRIRARVPAGVADRRRRRRTAAVQESYGGAGALLRDTAASGAGPGPLGILGTRRAAWLLVIAALLVIGLGVGATALLFRAAGSDLPQVTEIRAESSGGVVTFSWTDPGLTAGDTYQIRTTSDRSAGDQTSTQRTASYVVDAEPGERVCITVTVNRAGKSGQPSAESCAIAGQ